MPRYKLITITPAPGQSWPKLHLSEDGESHVCKMGAVIQMREWGEIEGEYLMHWHEILSPERRWGVLLICNQCMTKIGARKRIPRVKTAEWANEWHGKGDEEGDGE